MEEPSPSVGWALLGCAGLWLVSSLIMIGVAAAVLAFLVGAL